MPPAISQKPIDEVLRGEAAVGQSYTEWQEHKSGIVASAGTHAERLNHIKPLIAGVEVQDLPDVRSNPKVIFSSTHTIGRVSGRDDAS